MNANFKSIKIKSEVKNRFDIFKKRYSYSDCLEQMLAYFELTGVEPKLGQTPPVQIFLTSLKDSHTGLHKRLDDVIKIIRNIEMNKIDPVTHGIQMLLDTNTDNTQEVSVSPKEEEIYQVVQINEKLMKELKAKDLMIQKLKSDLNQDTRVKDIIDTIEELLSDKILSTDRDGNFLLSREHRNQLIQKVKTYYNV